MSTINYTLISRTHHCPFWDIDLSISAKYRFFDEKNPTIAKYSSCTCPIIENLKLPLHKQDKQYALYKFCNMQTYCLKSINFPDEIDVSKDSYSE